MPKGLRQRLLNVFLRDNTYKSLVYLEVLSRRILVLKTSSLLEHTAMTGTYNPVGTGIKIAHAPHLTREVLVDKQGKHQETQDLLKALNASLICTFIGTLTCIGITSETVKKDTTIQRNVLGVEGKAALENRRYNHKIPKNISIREEINIHINVLTTSINIDIDILNTVKFLRFIIKKPNLVDFILETCHTGR